MMTDIGEAAAAKVQHNINEFDKVIKVSVDIDNLAQGLLDTYKPPLEQVGNELQEILNKQEILDNKMQVENQHLTATAEDDECAAMYITVQAYQEKLSRIKREMALIHERTTKLKKRAIYLQQVKQKQALAKEQKREEELRREQELIGKPPSI
ncbi:Similar to BLOC1S6: Biogenesis of lysosome-related organelles complex 1 subunit 6 (Bos taurus) [Cotesia congregata]|uniref:Biogenesis of lysosome-related organelles complex 1 subunit 6 n=1 Tax=Cotesia congregata TaxID=51543 RepID=A0A8J2E8D8_COTCN|nr:Similar to BLOC1S6: Biogenesis of lysosome-related organelles complex 1 subunit 6 (Bos taurus) [Cotesia congregata]